MHTFKINRRQFLFAVPATGVLAACGGGGGGADTPDEGLVRLPAETEPQAELILSSPTADYRQGWSMLAVQVQMLREVLPHQKVRYLVNTNAADNPGANDEDRLRDALADQGLTNLLGQITFLKVAHSDLWARDFAGMWVRTPDGRLEVVDFDSDGYRLMPYSGQVSRDFYAFENDLSVRFAAAAGQASRRSPLITEGGNIVANGAGTVIAVQSSFTQSNPGMSLPQIEEELRRAIGARKVIWLPRSVASDAHPVLQTPYIFGTPGNERRVYNLGVNHADELVAWVDRRTVLLPEISAAEAAAATAAGDPTAEISRQVLEECYQILSTSQTADGEPIQIIRVPEPGAIEIELTAADGMYLALSDLNANPAFPLVGAESFVAGDPVRFMLAASYMNFVVTNAVVLIPRFFLPGRAAALQQKDEAFHAIIQAQYPTRRVVQVNVDALTVGGGGMHCITQQIPA